MPGDVDAGVRLELAVGRGEPPRIVLALPACAALANAAAKSAVGGFGISS